jgi:hypothetical protein
MHRLYTRDGDEVKEGAILTDFRRVKWEFISLTQNGRRVYVKKPGSAKGEGVKREFMLAVFPGCTIQE